MFDFVRIVGENLGYGNFGLCAARNPNPNPGEEEVHERQVVCGDLACDFMMTVPREVGRWRCDRCKMEQCLPGMEELPCYVSTSFPLAPRSPSSPLAQRRGSKTSSYTSGRTTSSCTSGRTTSSYTSGSKTNSSYISVDAHVNTTSPVTSVRILGENLGYGNFGELCAALNPHPNLGEEEVHERQVVCGDLACDFMMTVPREVGRWRCDRCKMEQCLPGMEELPCYVSTSFPLAPRSPSSPLAQRRGSKTSSDTSGRITSSCTSGNKTSSYTSVDAHAKANSPVTSVTTPAEIPIVKSPISIATTPKRGEESPVKGKMHSKDKRNVICLPDFSPNRLRAIQKEKMAENQDKIKTRLRATPPDKKDEFDEIYESIMNDIPLKDKSPTYNLLCSPTAQGGLGIFTSVISSDNKEMSNLGKSWRPPENGISNYHTSENLQTFALLSQNETPLRYLTHGVAGKKPT